MTTDGKKATERDPTEVAATARRRAMLAGSASPEEPAPAAQHPTGKRTPRTRGALPDSTPLTPDTASARRRAMLGIPPRRTAQ